jgi:putative membrane protein
MGSLSFGVIASMHRIIAFLCSVPLLFAVLLPQQAQAHAGDVGAHHWWTLDPWVQGPLLLVGVLYVAGIILLRSRQHAGSVVKAPALASALVGWLALFFALAWGLDAFSETSFAAHMAQHMLLISVAAPLLALARTGVPVTAAIAAMSPLLAASLSQPRKWLRLCLLPSIAFALHGAVIWIWHAPLLFELALYYEWIHRLEHLSFFVTGYWYWSVLLRSGRSHGEGYGAAAMWSLSTLMHTGLLGALITFAPRPLYPAYIAAQGGIEAALQDQQLAGLLMWIPTGACYLLGGLGFAAAWMNRAEHLSATEE